jgi:hypothetical protein
MLQRRPEKEEAIMFKIVTAFAVPAVFALVACAGSTSDTGSNAGAVKATSKDAGAPATGPTDKPAPNKNAGPATKTPQGPTDVGDSKPDPTVGKPCGGADRVNCAAGYVCFMGDDEPVGKGEGTPSEGTCQKDDAPDLQNNVEQCTPGADVFCRCADRREGNKKCLADGQSYDACVCTGEIPE